MKQIEKFHFYASVARCADEVEHLDMMDSEITLPQSVPSIMLANADSISDQTHSSEDDNCPLHLSVELDSHFKDLKMCITIEDPQLLLGVRKFVD